MDNKVNIYDLPELTNPTANDLLLAVQTSNATPVVKKIKIGTVTNVVSNSFSTIITTTLNSNAVNTTVLNVNNSLIANSTEVLATNLVANTFNVTGSIFANGSNVEITNLVVINGIENLVANNLQATSLQASNTTVETLLLNDSNTPANSTITISKGRIFYDDTYLYIVTADNTVKRITLESF